MDAKIVHRILKINKTKSDRLQILQTETQTKIDDLFRSLDQTIQELAKEQKFVEENPDTRTYYEQFYKASVERQTIIKQEITKAVGKLATIQEQIKQLFINKKQNEKILENINAKIQKEELSKEIAQLNEFGIHSFAKKD